MRKKIVALLGALALSLGIVVAVASPASAAAWDCPKTNGSGQYIVGCLYPDANGGGAPYLMGNNAGCHNLTGGWLNIASSVKHGNAAYRIVIWPYQNCSGGSTELFPGNSFNLPKYTTSRPFNNDTESWAIYPWDCCP